ncbi:MAG: hypothetical protein IIW08_06790, partial [Clostridia bacterium]|nr:hypothetical protein [Clostridia bacterium]
ETGLRKGEHCAIIKYTQKRKKWRRFAREKQVPIRLYFDLSRDVPENKPFIFINDQRETVNLSVLPAPDEKDETPQNLFRKKG